MNILEISKAEVLGKDFTRVHELLQDIACSAQELQDTRNTWDLLFTGYEDDPRDIPEMAEVNRWVRASLEEGIPWLYLLGTDEDYTGLHLLLLCCCTQPDPDQPEARLLDPEAVDGFVAQGMRSVGDFGADHGIPEEVLSAAVHRSMDFIYQLLAEEQEDMENGEAIDEPADAEPSPLELEIQERLQILLDSIAPADITLTPGALYCSEPMPDGNHADVLPAHRPGRQVGLPLRLPGQVPLGGGEGRPHRLQSPGGGAGPGGGNRRGAAGAAGPLRGRSAGYPGIS